MKQIAKIGWISLLFILVCVQKNYAQIGKVIQLYGIVRGGDSSSVLPGATVLVENSGRGTIANDIGIFSIAVSPGDKIEFSFIGYKTVNYRVPGQINGNDLMVSPVLEADTNYLPTTILTPLPLPEIFKIIFLKTEPPKDKYDVAMENLNIKHMLQQMRYYRPSGPGAINMLHQQQSIYQGSQKGLLPSTGIFNPLSWYDFIKSLKEGGNDQ